MNIDFHYGVIYLVSRLAGMNPVDAQIVAHSSQYVDDATTPGILQFAGGEQFQRIASAHEMLDFRNEFNSDNKLVWTPFHFLPGGEGNSLEDKAICKPDSAIAKAMVKRSINGRQAENALHRLGVTLHVYVDTWAHQGFTGMVSKHNVVVHLQGDDYDHNNWFSTLAARIEGLGESAAALSLDVVSGLGHGVALHFPDMPWAKWEYTNGHGITIFRNNLPDFVEAADMACKAVQGFLKGNVEYESETGLPNDAKHVIERIFESNRSHDPAERLHLLSQKIRAGEIPGICEEVPVYISKGPNSWKHLATGIAEKDDGTGIPSWSEHFEESDYRKVHDAIKLHRFVITEEILPAHQLRLV